MKNKKGKKGQEIQRQVQNSGFSKADQQKQEAAAQRKAEKQAKWEKEQEAAMLFKKVEDKQKPQIVPIGVNPKSVLCIYFKKGYCQAGEQCKLSHDMDIENKQVKKDMYTDTRELSSIELGDMKDWDENTLRTVLKKKEAGRPANASQQICKHFIKAIEESKWGWFWECPNGNNTCVYRHALPPDYVLKKDMKKEKVETRALEAVLEDERAKLTGVGTKVTPETFAAWREKNRKAKEKDQKKADEERKQQLKSGKVRMTGREIMESGLSKYAEEEDGDDTDVDIMQLLKEKQKVEVAIDEENAILAAELAKEVEAELARNAEEGTLMKDPNVEDKKPKTNTNNNTNSNNTNDNSTNNNSNGAVDLAAEPTAVLTGVDVNLFQAEDVEEDVEFSDEEEDNGKK